MNPTDTEVTDIQSKLSNVNQTIQRLSAEAENLSNDSALGLDLFAKPEDDPNQLLEAARKERDALEARLKDLEPGSVILLEAKWREADRAIANYENRSVKSTNYEYYRDQIHRLTGERDELTQRIGALRAEDLGPGIATEADRIVAEIAQLTPIVDELEDLDNPTEDQAKRLEDAENRLHELRHLAAELRPYSVALLDAEAVRLETEIAEITKQYGGTFPTSFGHLKTELDTVYAQRSTLLDTGHYDDGHAFGWKQPESKSNNRTLKIVAAAIAAVVALVAGAVALANGGGSSKTSTAGSSASSSVVESSSSDSTPVVALPANTVLASCLQLDVRPGATTMIETFLTAPMVPGSYQVVLDTGNGAKSGSGTVAPGASFAAIPVEFTQFTTINGISITGPNGAIAPGTFENQFPFELNAANDHPTDCDGSKLEAPVPAASAGGGDVKTEIAGFLDELARNTRSADGVDELAAALNPAVIARYGADTCKSYLASTTDPTAAFTVVDVGAPAAFDYTSDGQTTSVPNTFSVTVQQTQNGQTAQKTVHVARDASGAFSWFTRCRAA